MSTSRFDASEFDPDFEAYPSTATLSVVRDARAVGEASNHDLPFGDWERDFTLNRPGLATDPLTATFTDLDLDPARAVLPAGLDDSDYWTE